MTRILGFILIVLFLCCKKDPSTPHEIKKALAFFIAINDSTSNLWYIQPNSLSFTRLLADNAGTATDNPAWSADGRRIYFIRRTKSKGINGIYVIKSDGTDYRSIIKDNETQLRRFHQLILNNSDADIIFSLDLERNGRKVVELYEMSISGSGVSRITNFEITQPALQNTEAYAGSFSPDDSLIVFSQSDPTITGKKDVRIFTLKRATAELKLLRTLKATDVLGCAPAYSPDGKSLLFSIDGLIHTMRADGSELKPVGSVKGYHPIWDPNGKDIYFSYYGINGMRRGIYVCDINLTTIKIISRGSKYGEYGGLSINK